VSADAALRELLDREAIRELVRRYAHCVWQRDASGAAALFAADGSMDTGDRPPLRGRGAIRAEYEASFAVSHFRPMLHNHVIDLAGDRATGTCYLELTARVSDVEMLGRGHYDDAYVREQNGWKFASRVLTLTQYSEANAPTP
jgi:uncharacterized protein (TIGR02246 family)